MSEQYNAGNIQVLKGLEAVRMRPGMYIGSTGPAGLHHLVYEVVDNSVDEALAGYCKNIHVVIEKDEIISVSDDGRGIPVDLHPVEGVSALEVVMTRLHAGGKFDKDTYAVSGGLHGVGVSVVNALSQWLEVNVYREGKHYFQNYTQGDVQCPVQEKGTATKSGTIVRFKADATIFTETTHYSFDILASRLRELAFLNKGICITLTDQREESTQSKEFYFEDGVNGFVSFLNAAKATLHPDPLYVEEQREGCQVEISMQYNDTYSETVYTFVNNINTREGGTHLIGFKSALTRVINDFMRDSKHAKKLTEPLSGEDVREGLVAVVSVKIPNPQFEGQTKQKLGNSEVKGMVESVVYERLKEFFETNPKTIDIILEKAALAASVRFAARKARDLARRKSTLGGAGLPDKLADCSDRDPANCEIFIVEGDSAGGSAKEGRDRRTQAILPLWGKMLNVEKTRLEKVLDNEKLLPVILALGAGIGETFDVTKLRYHKVVIMADADVDGSHIRTLLLTFLFRYMPKLIEDGYVYLAMPPLYKVTKGRKEFYAYTEEEKTEVVLREGIDLNKDEIQRYKGLGEMNSDELGLTTMDRTKRSLKRVTMEDAVEADATFSMLMGDQVPPRRKFIEDNALYVTNLDI
ncbi:MAG: DNA topoisomerase (ATP-hydrolyzing) subunit B [Spirochaetia bacterium]